MRGFVIAVALLALVVCVWTLYDEQRIQNFEHRLDSRVQTGGR